jgi:hypothetical protein
LAAREKRTEPTQENITLCYESRVTFPALQGFHVVRRAPGVLPLADRYRARAVPRKRPRPPAPALGFITAASCNASAQAASTPLATCRNGNGGHEGNGARNSNASARSVSTPFARGESYILQLSPKVKTGFCVCSRFKRR